MKRYVRVLSVLLAAVLAFSSMPVYPVFATDSSGAEGGIVIVDDDVGMDGQSSEPVDSEDVESLDSAVGEPEAAEADTETVPVDDAGTETESLDETESGEAEPGDDAVVETEAADETESAGDASDDDNVPDKMSPGTVSGNDAGVEAETPGETESDETKPGDGAGAETEAPDETGSDETETDGGAGDDGEVPDNMNPGTVSGNDAGAEAETPGETEPDGEISEPPVATPSDAEKGDGEKKDETEKAAAYSLSFIAPYVEDAGAKFQFSYSIIPPDEDVPVEGSYTVCPEEVRSLDSVPDGAEWSVTLDAPKGYVFDADSWDGIIDGSDVVIAPVVVHEPVEHDFVFEPDEDTLADESIPYGKKVSVGVDLLDGTSLPDGTGLEVEYLEPDTPEYEAAMSVVTETLSLPEDGAFNALLYDIHFLSEGAEIEPEGRVRVTVGFRGSSEDVTWRTVVHAKDDGTSDVLDTEWSDEMPDDGISADGVFYDSTSEGITSVRFEVDGFSLFGFVEVPEEAPDAQVQPEQPVSPAELVRVLDDGTVVTVAPDEGVVVPDGAELHVDVLDEAATEAALDAARKALELSEDDALRYFPYDIYFTGTEGERLDSFGRMRVTVEYQDDPFAGMSNKAELFALCETPDGSVQQLEASQDGSAYTFSADSCAVMGPAMSADAMDVRTFTCTLEDGTVVTVVIGEGVKLPDGAEFHAEFLDEDDPRMTEVMEALRKAMGLSQKEAMNFFPCDIYFTDADGNRIDMDGSMRVTVEFGGRFADVEWGNRVVRLNADGTAEELASEWSDDGHTVTFDVDSLSVLGFASPIDAGSAFTCELEGGITVKASLDKGTKLPEGAKFHAEVIDGARVKQLTDAARETLGLTKGDRLYFYPVDVYFTDADGAKVEPEGAVTVTLEYGEDPFAEAAKYAETAEGTHAGLFALHEKSDGHVEKLDAAREDSEGKFSFTFTVDSFSPMGPAVAVTEHDFIYKLDGGVTVAIDLQEGSTLPEGAVLKMQLVEQDSQKYAGTMETAMSGFGAAKAAFYDIHFMVGDEEVWPTGGVRVTVLFDRLPANVENREVVQVKDNGSVEPLEADWTESSLDSGSVDGGSDDEAFSDEGLADGGHVSFGSSASVVFDVDSISLFGLMGAQDRLRIVSGEQETVSWGDISVEGVVQSDDEDGVRAWDVSNSSKRYVDVPVEILVSQNKNITITLDRYIKTNVREGFAEFDKAEVVTRAASAYCNHIDVREDSIVLEVPAGNGSHVTFQLPYQFDCWAVRSGMEFAVHYRIHVDGEDENQDEQGALKGKIVTGHGLKIVNKYGSDQLTYFDNGGRGNGFSLGEFGGADFITSYILNYSQVYETYFGLDSGKIAEIKENLRDSDSEYIYDIAPFLVKPSGQQPYDISGTVTVENGEVLGGVYMMNSVQGSKASWKTLQVKSESEGSYTFEFRHNENFTGPVTDTGRSLLNRVVTGNLTDTVDNQRYTLYFLVRYKKSELSPDNLEDTTHWSWVDVYTLKAGLELTHKGIDDSSEQQDRLEQVLYKGPLTKSQIYDAYYNYYVSNQRDALSHLDKEKAAELYFEADFFCYNEARGDFNESIPDKYRLEAVIDLFYLTGKKPYDTASVQLALGDYRFSEFSLSLVDAPGNWSQNWYYEDNGDSDDTVWQFQHPNVGWPDSTWGNPKETGYGQVVVYGSSSHNGDWQQVATFDVADIWAKDQGRSVSNKHTFQAGEEYVRLKVVYDSRWTTALRVGYEVELQPDLLNKEQSSFDLKTTPSQELTAWFNYFGYRKTGEGNSDKEWSADTDNMNCERYLHFDGDWSYDWQGDEGTAALAREYDEEQAGKMDFNQNFNTDTDRNAKTYSMRDYVRIILGRMEDQAGMLVTQALYDVSGKIVGSDNIWPDNGSPDNGSFCKVNEVTDVSEVVYTISGGVTNGAMSWNSLQERRREADSESPFNSLHIRYYVLLPEDFRLKKDAVSPHHGSNAEYLSPNPAFYDEGTKKTGADNTILTSTSNIPAWKELSTNGALSQMYWNDAGSVTLNDALTKGQLVVFDRTLEDTEVAKGEVFNLHGATETYFWGRGLTFSIEPKDGTGSVWTKYCTVHVWCQYLDAEDNPVSLQGFKKGVEDVKDSELNVALPPDKQAEANTLLYIPSTFHNTSVAGSTKAGISLNSEYKNAEGEAVVPFEHEYKYKIEYGTSTRMSQNVILWSNIEEHYTSDPQYRGTVTGVDLTELPDVVQNKVRVYVKNEHFDADRYTEGNANSGWFENEGWKEVPEGERETYDWSQVKAIAFYFEGVIFNENGQESDIKSVAVYVKMMGPNRGDYCSKLDGKSEKTFDAVSSLLFSDQHEAEVSEASLLFSDQHEAEVSEASLLFSDLHEAEVSGACTPANKVPVSVIVRSVNLPITGGPGVLSVLTCSFSACLAGLAMVLAGRKRRRKI